MQQSNAAATALYDQPSTAGGSLHNNAGPSSDAGDAVMARWLQSAGLQHLASPLASTGTDHRHLPNLLMQVLRQLFLQIDWAKLNFLLWFVINWVDCGYICRGMEHNLLRRNKGFSN